MEPQTDLPDLVEDLEVNIDELAEALQPLLAAPIHTTASSLPLLDKSKLYVLTAYAIESLLFSALQASGTNAKEHPIFNELGRLKGYFAKIKEVEERGAQPKTKLDVGAAARFIKHGLAGNDKYDLQRAERMAKERAKAALKARRINKKFDDEDEGKSADQEPTKGKKRSARDIEAQDSKEFSDDEILGGLQDPGTEETTEPATKKARVSAVSHIDPAGGDTSTSETAPQKSSKKSKSKGSKSSNKSTGNSSADDSQTARMPKTHSETLAALLDGSAAAKAKKGRSKGKGKGK